MNPRNLAVTESLRDTLAIRFLAGIAAGGEGDMRTARAVAELEAMIVEHERECQPKASQQLVPEHGDRGWFNAFIDAACSEGRADGLAIDELRRRHDLEFDRRARMAVEGGR